ncbi:protein BEAN1 isoform X2 [Nomascus leucogenys]|uniref:protein BEAN1 isoform X2 n=1 Tax=Nomascus leucogenys TaxID=61853 RepID=UPI00122D9716|nr:protein BEAN1 isoform X2 [Nomascus leucogenys]
MSFKRPCPLARYNRTSYFYPTFSESSEHSHLLVSPVLVASAVIGVVIILSCITIIVGSIRRDRQARLQRHRHRHHRHHHHHHHHHRRRHREYEHGYVSDGHTYSRSSHRMRYACSSSEDWPPPLDISSDGDMDATVLRELYPDSPPGVSLSCLGWSAMMYTGSFTYWMQSVLSRHKLDTILGRLGYTATLESEFSLVQAISKEDVKQMVFEIFLVRVSCEAVVRTTGTWMLEPGTEKLAGTHSRHSSEKRLVKPCSCLEGVQPGPGSGGPQQGPSEGVGSERALAEGTADQRSLPMALSPSEVSTAPNSLPSGSPVL